MPLEDERLQTPPLPAGQDKEGEKEGERKEDEESQVSQTPKKKGKAKKKTKATAATKKAIVDSTVDLDSQQYNSTRQEYTRMIGKENVDASVKAFDKSERERARAAVGYIPPSFGMYEEMSA